MSTKKYKCPYCNARLERSALIKHVDKSHQELIPDGFTSTRIVYNSVNKTDGGKCRVCGKPTEWREDTGRYDVLCKDPKCKQKMRDDYKKNMLRVRGTYNILNDPEQQEKMLANRSISGEYQFSDGGKVGYTGTYEKKCLEFMDVVMQIKSDDIMSPGPSMEYTYNGAKHIYIPDFYYVPYNLIIEVKDGGDNPNTKLSPGMKSSRERTIEKERMITDKGIYNYIRLTNNNFQQLIEVFMGIKYALIEGDPRKTVKINESSDIDFFEEYESLSENGIITTKDLEYNLDQWKIGGKNILFITGLSGSGKSTKAAKLAKENNAVNIEIDLFEHNDIVFDKNTNNDEGNLIVKEYFEKKYGGARKMPQGDPKLPHMLYDFIKYCINYASKHKDRLFVMEGIQLADLEMAEELKNYPVIIVNTSIIKSMYRAAKREGIKDYFNSFKSFSDFLGWFKWYLQMDKNNKKFAKDLKESTFNESTTPKNCKRLNNYGGSLYFVSQEELNGKVLAPRIPDNYFTKNNYEDNTIKRVCFAPSIDKCLMGLSQNLKGKEFYVYEPDGEYEVYKPDKNLVPDSLITGELWILKPVKLKRVNRIKVIDDAGEDGIPFYYGDNKAELYKWNYEIIDESAVPEKCKKCGGDIKVYLRGEPVYLCADCGEYYGTVPFKESAIIKEDGMVAAASLFYIALFGVFAYSTLSDAKKKYLDPLKYSYIATTKELKAIPKNGGYKDAKFALATVGYFHLNYRQADKGIIYKTSIAKNNMVYLYKFNSKEFKLIDNGKFEDLCKKNDIQIKEFTGTALTNRKEIYDNALKLFKDELKGNKLLNSSKTEWGSNKDALNEFCSGKDDSISIYYLDLWSIMPDARTRDPERIEWCNKEIYGKLEEVAKKVNSKLPKGYKVEYAGDWDGLLYSLEAPKASNESSLLSLQEAASNLVFIDINRDKNTTVKYLKQRNSKYTNYLDNYIGEIIVDQDKDKLAGQVFIGKKGTKDEGFITGLEVYKPYKNKGLGSKLLDDAVKKYNGIDLTVYKDNDIAIRMYKKYGFVILGPGNTKNNDYYMKLKSKVSKSDKKSIKESSGMTADQVDRFYTLLKQRLDEDEEFEKYESALTPYNKDTDGPNEFPKEKSNFSADDLSNTEIDDLSFDDLDDDEED
jgi:ribosomal protein S18 acetylase RimI-like enzyme